MVSWFQRPTILYPNPVAGASGKPRAIVVDLDRTIAETSYRDKKAARYEYQSDEWYATFSDPDYIKYDKPFPDAAKRLWEYVALGHTIIYLTGRHEHVMTNSVTWLRDHGFPLFPVVYQFKNPKQFNEHKTAEFKKAKLLLLMKEYDIVTLFDDWDKVIEAVGAIVSTYHVKDFNFWTTHVPPLPNDIEDLNVLSAHLEQEHLASAPESEDKTHHIRMGVAIARLQELIRDRTKQVGSEMREESWPRENPAGIVAAAIGGILAHFGTQAVAKALEYLVDNATPRENPETCSRKLVEPDDIKLFHTVSAGWVLDWEQMYQNRPYLRDHFYVYRCGSGQPLDAFMVLLPEDNKSVPVEVVAIESAPWNRAEYGQPLVHGLGRKMIYDAITASNKLGHSGSISLDAHVDAIPFYQKIGMSRTHHNHFHFTPAKAKAYQAKYRKPLAVRENPIDNFDFTAGGIPPRTNPTNGLLYGEPYASRIFLGETKYIVSPVDLKPHFNEPLVLLGNKAYGVVTLKEQEHINLEDFWKSGVSPTFRDSWWPDAKYFFLYLFDFVPFLKPESYRPTEQKGPIINDVVFGEVPVEPKEGVDEIVSGRRHPPESTHDECGICGLCEEEDEEYGPCSVPKCKGHDKLRKNPIVLTVPHAYPDFEGHYTDHAAEPLAYAIFKELSARGFKPETLKPETRANPRGHAFVALSENGTVPLFAGTVLTSRGDPTELPVEKLFEKIRKTKYPQLPSRLKVIFLAPDLASALRWGALRQWATNITSQIWEVEYLGNTHIADAMAFEEARESKGKKVDAWIHSYWKGKMGVSSPEHPEADSLPELLVDGKVVLLRFVGRPRRQLRERVLKSEARTNPSKCICPTDDDEYYQEHDSDCPVHKGVTCDICKEKLGIALTSEDAMKLFNEHIKVSRKCAKGVRHTPDVKPVGGK